VRGALTALSGFFALLFVGYSFINSARLSRGWDDPSVVTPTDLFVTLALLVPALAAYVLREVVGGRGLLEILKNEDTEQEKPRA
jgi:hypothetical protein